MAEFQPMFLIAVPQMGDPNFSKAIVLILHHDTEGALGLVLNHPTKITLSRFSDSQGLICHRELESRVVYTGGPVEPERGWVLHNNPSVEEKQEVSEGLYVSGTNDTLKGFLKEGEDSFRLLLGYSGWSAGQLEEEMVEGAWITAKVDPKYVFDVPADQAWQSLLQEMGVDPNRLMVGSGLH